MRAVVALALSAATLAGVQPAEAAPPYGYVGAATVVTQLPTGQTVIDNGVVFCDPYVTNNGSGGFCIPFADIIANGATLTVTDEVSGTAVSYQVCQDNNGNGVCADGLGGDCADEIVYSHAGSSYANPMSGLPTSAPPGCPGSLGFEGLVVFMCTGAHETHAEAGTAGTATLGGTGTPGFTEGSLPAPFCGGAAFRGKAYVPTAGVPARDAAVGVGTATVSTGPSSSCSGGPVGLGIPSTTPVSGWLGISTSVVVRDESGSLALCVPIGPTGPLGAGCGVTTGGDGEGTIWTSNNSYTFSNVRWPAQIGTIVPVSGTARVNGQNGPMTGLMEFRPPPGCATGQATEFNVSIALSL